MHGTLCHRSCILGRLVVALSCWLHWLFWPHAGLRLQLCDAAVRVLLLSLSGCAKKDDLQPVFPMTLRFSPHHAQVNFLIVFDAKNWKTTQIYHNYCKKVKLKERLKTRRAIYTFTFCYLHFNIKETSIKFIKNN